MKKEIKEALDNLSKLDLLTYPYDDVKDNIRKLGRFGCIIQSLNPGKTIMRARINTGSERFLSKDLLSYKPQQCNKTYQRASTPNKTMFYGGVLHEKIADDELKVSRVIGAFEAIPMMRSPLTSGYQMITYSRWLVTKKIELMAVVQHESFYKENSYTRELVDGFKKFVESQPELREETLAIADFFSKEFAKENVAHDYDYLISAIFSELVVNNGLDGDFYPSVRIGGQGFNIALSPEAADNCLELAEAGECSLYKFKGKVVVDNETALSLNPGQINFNLEKVEDKYHVGQSACLKSIGASSMNDLK